MGWLKLTQEFQSACLSGELLRGEMKTRRTDIHLVQNANGLGMEANRYFTHSFHVSRMC